MQHLCQSIYWQRCVFLIKVNLTLWLSTNLKGKKRQSVSNLKQQRKMAENDSSTPETSLTKAQLERIEKNKLKAQTLKKSKLIPHPYSKW